MKVLLRLIAFLSLLSSINHLQGSEKQWQRISTPLDYAIKSAHLLSKETGYIFYENARLFEYTNGKWHEIDLPKEDLVERVYVVAKNLIWAVVRSPGEHGNRTMRYSEGRWRPIVSPNIDRIRHLAFENPASGWAACEWGEIMRYQDGEWCHVPSPTRFHINKIFFDQSGGRYALTEYYGQGELLKWNGAEWVKISKLNSEFSKGYAFTENNLLLVADGELLRWNGAQIENTTIFDSRLIDIGFFTAQSGIAITDKALLSFDGNDITTQIDKPEKSLQGITISRDGGAWAYGVDGLLLTYGKFDSVSQSADIFKYDKPIFTIFQMDFGKIQGAAFLNLTPNRSSIYLVEHENQNLIIPFENDTISPGIQGTILTANYGLDEPENNQDKRRIYDHAVLTADFNNDGYEDVFLSCLYRETFLFLNTRYGSFENATEWAGLKQDSTRIGRAATADIDNDGDLDLFLPNEMGSSHFYINNGFAKFARPDSDTGVYIKSAAKAAAFADIDGNGWMDLAVTTFGEGTLLFRNTGQGNFEDITAKSPALQPGPFEKCNSLAFADYDNDGDFDLFICKEESNNALLQNNGAGIFVDVSTQAGIKDSSRTQGAVFFDPDNDSDLDIYLTNKDADNFYLNNGDGSFHSNPQLIQSIEFGWLPYTHLPQFTVGAVVFDDKMDGNLDLLVSGFNGKSRLLSNRFHNQNFLSFKLTGRESNFSAIGATVTLYTKDNNNNANKISGIRMIESVSGYGSHSQKLIHFGVKAHQTYEAEIVFPGGKRLKRQNLTAGNIMDITENSPWYTSRISLLRNKLIGYESYKHRQQILLTIISLAFVALILYQKFWWSVRALAFLAGFCLFIFVAIHLIEILIEKPFWPYWPIISSTLAGSLFFLLSRERFAYQLSNVSMEALSLNLQAFAHSKLFSNHLSALKLQLANMPVEAGLSPLSARKCQQNILFLNNQITPEIQLIAKHLYFHSFSLSTAGELKRRWQRLQQNVWRLNNSLKKQKSPRAAIIAQIQDDLASAQELLIELRENIRKYETADVVAVINNSIELFEDGGMEIIWHPSDKNAFVHIAPNELQNLITELFTNASYAMQQSVVKRLEIKLMIQHQRVIIEISDTGCGVSPEQKELIFERNFSSHSTGGFGLFHARQTVEKYQGTIFLKDTEVGMGANFQIILKRVMKREKSS